MGFFKATYRCSWLIGLSFVLQSHNCTKSFAFLVSKIGNWEAKAECLHDGARSCSHFQHESSLAKCAVFVIRTMRPKSRRENKTTVLAESRYEGREQNEQLEGLVNAASLKQDEADQWKDHRFGFVSIIGAPNMGKSTLMNALLREDLCVATRRPQTTRHAILGVMTQKGVQLAFTDTPGIIDQPAYKLQEGMMEAVKGALNDADILLLVTDVFSTPIPDDVLFQKIQSICRSQTKPVIVAINKCDLLDKISPKKLSRDDASTGKENLEEQEAISNETSGSSFANEIDNKQTFTVAEAVERWRSLLPKAVAIIPLIANQQNNAGVDFLRDLLCGGPDVPASIRALGRPVPGMFQPGVQFISNDEARAFVPACPPMYEEDTLTDRTERFFASEIIRAAVFESFKKEVPYCTEVQVTQFKEDNRSEIIRMSATIYVERESQKGIVVGKGGQQIKVVGVRARKALENFFQSKIYLDLSVKVDKDWRRKEQSLKKFGYMR